MAEVAAVPHAGLDAVSLFSGCGGSSLGYRMAGFRVLWASEFIPAAAEVYRLNHPETILDTRDIRAVTPEEILAAIGKREGELDLLDGSPPCASFSTAGKREAGWGKVKAYSDSRQRVDDLFFEYARILRGLKPRTFVAENVSGLVKGTAKGYFLEILRELKACGYKVEARLLDAQWLGVPQMRQRIIFLGVRDDLGLGPAFPAPLPYRYSVRDALPWLTGPSPTIITSTDRVPLVEARVVYQPGGACGTIFGGCGDVTDRPCPAILAGHQRTDDFVVVGRDDARAYRDKRGAFGNDGDITDAPAPTVLTDSVGTHWVAGPSATVGTPKGERSLDEPAPAVLSHGRRRTQSELSVVEADMTGYAVGRKWDGLRPGESVYYGGTSVSRPHLDRPCPTVTQRGGDVSAASVTHPTERRKFTIAELRRICAFPDDFALTGTYAQQWERLGRAVPPPMMRAIAEAVRDRILRPIPGTPAPTPGSPPSSTSG